MDLFYGRIDNDSVFIDEEDQRHIAKVMRMKEGTLIEVTDGKGRVAKGEIAFEGKKVILNTIEVRIEKPKLSKPIHIAIAPTKNIDRTEFFIEKATEMGIGEITFLLTENSERKNINLERFIKKVIAASKQSQRYHFPKINPLTKLYDFLPLINPVKTFVAHCDIQFDRTKISDLNLDQDSCFMVGPEGDFSKHEINHLLDLKIKAVTLGSQRLRTETAGIFITAWAYAKQI